MAAQLPDLRALKGWHRVFAFHGQDGLGDHPSRTFLTNYYVVSDPDDLKEEGPGHTGHRHLTFSICVANRGRGPLILEMRKTSKNRAKVAQLVPDDTKPRELWERRDAGSAVRDTQPDHNHWHYDAFLQYRLKSIRTGKFVGSPRKQSFCLEDVAKLRSDAPRRGFTRCPNPRASVGTMGITPGWGDVYWDGVQEQFIEVKGLPPGRYWLECIVDPASQLRVKSRRRMKTRVKIRLG